MGSWRLWWRMGACAENCGASEVAVPRRRGGPVLGQGCMTASSLCSLGFGPDSAENCGVPAVASFVILRCSSSSWTRLVTCPRWQVLGPRQFTDAFG